MKMVGTEKVKTGDKHISHILTLTDIGVAV